MSVTMSKGKKSVFPQKRVVGTIITVVVLAAAGVLAWTILHPQPKTTTKTMPKGIEARSVDAIRQDIGKTTDPTKKSALYGELTTAEQQKGNQDAALEASMAATDTKATATGYAVTALLYQDKGDKAKAIEYFKKAVALTEPTNDADANVPYNTYKHYIIALGGSL